MLVLSLLNMRHVHTFGSIEVSTVNVGFHRTFFVQVLRFLNLCVLLAAYRFTGSFSKEYERVLKARITHLSLRQEPALHYS